MPATKRWSSVFCLLAVYGGYDRIGELIKKIFFVKQANNKKVYFSSNIN
jgi:hypothetical protein